jgi:hypothetical protein
MSPVPERWRFCFSDDEVSLPHLSWHQAVRLFRDAESGELTGQSDGECVSLEFDATHAAVLYMGQDAVILRPYFPRESVVAQDVGQFFCGSCGIRKGHQDEYLMRFLLNRVEGFALFRAVLAGSPLPTQLPDPEPSQPALPGFEELLADRVFEWRPLRSTEAGLPKP